MKPTMNQPNGGKTGSPPGMLQDDCRELSKWLSAKPNAKQEARDACEHINTSLHRPVMVLDDACAEECAVWNRANAEADAPDLYEAPQSTAPKGSPPPAGSIYWFVVAASLVFFCCLIGSHALASWGPKAGEIWVFSGHEDKECMNPRVKILEVSGLSVRTLFFTSNKVYIFAVDPMRNFVGPFSYMKVDPHNCRPEFDFSYPQS